MIQWGLNPFSRRRDRLHIIAVILEIAGAGTLKTQVMYKASLSFTQLNDYLEFMLRASLLDKIPESERERYRATAKGMDFLQRYRKLVELLRTEENDGRNKNIRVPTPYLIGRN